MSARRGWCPTVFAPMPTGDGLLARVKPFGGLVPAAAAGAIGAAARQWGNGITELTGRGNLQVRGLAERDVAAFAAAMVAVGMADADPLREARRNVLVSPLAGVDPAVDSRTREVAAWVEAVLAETADLPPKYAAVVDGGGVLPLIGVAGDWVLRAPFRVTEAPSPRPSPAQEREREKSIPLTRSWAGEGGARPQAGRVRVVGFTQYTGHIGAFGLAAPFGRLAAEGWAALADMAEQFGDGLLRLTPWRAVLIAGIDRAAAAILAARAEAAGMIADPDDPRLRIVACAGAPACVRATVDTHATAAALATSTLPAAFIHVSGCEKGCAHPDPAPLTLVGTEGVYGLVRDGGASGQIVGLLKTPSAGMIERTTSDIRARADAERISQAEIDVRHGDAPAAFASVRAVLVEHLAERAGAPGAEIAMLPDRPVWGVRRQDHDLQGEWITEAVLAAESGRLRLGMRLSRRSSHAGSATRAVPRFLREIARRFDVYLDGVAIGLDATPVDTDEEVETLVALLQDPKRRHPIVAISAIDAAGATLVDADILAKHVFGTAHVRRISRRAAFRLTDRLGKRLSVYNGAARIWRGVIVSENDDPYQHRLLFAARLGELGPDGAGHALAEEVLRLSATRRDLTDPLPSLTDIRLAAAMKRPSAEGAELMQLYEAENTRLVEAVRETKAEQAALLEHADAELAAVTDELLLAHEEIRMLRARLSVAEHADRSRLGQAEIFIPDDLDALETWAGANLSANVEILPRALRAAKGSELEDATIAYRSLLLLDEAYVPMRRGEDTARQRWNEGLSRLGLECSRSHTGTRAGEHPDDYFVRYDGRRTEIDWHLKGGNSRNPRYCFRLYFFWSAERERVVVASLPAHLQTRIT